MHIVRDPTLRTVLVLIAANCRAGGKVPITEVSTVVLDTATVLLLLREGRY
jgi:hypothetical protein